MIKINTKILGKCLRIYLDSKPTFLAIIRAKEASIFNGLLPFKAPVLDYGCGDGFFAKLSHLDSNQRVDIGLETDFKRARLAKRCGIYKKVVTYNGGKIPLSSGSISTVISNSVMEHVDGLNEAIKEIYRIIKPGGFFYLSIITADYEDNLLGTKLLGPIYKRWMRQRAYHLNLLSLVEWEKLFNQAGFKVSEKLPYLNKNNTRWLDFLQYLSIPAIITQKKLPFISRLYCQLMRRLLENKIKAMLISDKTTSTSSACFYILKK